MLYSTPGKSRNETKEKRLSPFMLFTRKLMVNEHGRSSDSSRFHRLPVRGTVAIRQNLYWDSQQRELFTVFT
jgi:hypothetical protein